MEEEQMKVLADSLWNYFFKKYVRDYLSDSVCYFMATVTEAPTSGTIKVQRGFDTEIVLPYAWSASTLQVGDTCLVLVFGDILNAIVIGIGDLSDPGLYITKAGLLQSTGDAIDNTMSQDAITQALDSKASRFFFAFTAGDWTLSGATYTLSLAASAHGCGTNPMVQVLTGNGSAYEAYYGYPSEGWKMSIDASGNITLTTETPFDGEIVVR